MIERRQEIIKAKCKESGCDPKTARRHCRLYTTEHWDVHPPQEFRDWMRLRQPRTKAVTGWNAAGIRQEWDQDRAYGIDREPDFIPPREEQLANLATIKRLVAEIGKPMPKPLPTDYDKGAIGPATYDVR